MYDEVDVLRPDDPTHVAALRDPERLAQLAATQLLDGGAQVALERFTRLATGLIGVPVSLVSVVAADRQYFPATAGLTGWSAEERQTPLSHAFCQHVVSTGTLVVDDATLHPVLKDNLAVPDLAVRAYLGVPLVSASGHRLGAFCAIDAQPRAWTDTERDLMEDLAAAVSTDLQLRALASAHAHAATHDALTGLPNRRLLMSELHRRLLPDAAPSVLAILDLDGFKTYNDTFGHLAGDDLLVRIGERLLNESQRLGGQAYRLGGDEFCLLLPAGDRTVDVDVDVVAAAIAEQHEAQRVTASVGSVHLVAGMSVSEALGRADEQLYARKRGRAGGGAPASVEVLPRALTAQRPDRSAPLTRRGRQGRRWTSPTRWAWWAKSSPKCT